jgi:hypothetical protein
MGKTDDDGGQDAGQGTDGGGLEDRVGQLETGQQSLTGKVDRILGIVSGSSSDGSDGGDGGGQDAGQPGSIAEEIRVQLDERDAASAAAADDQAKTDRLGALETKVAELAEKPPAPMPRRVEKFWGWR